MVKKHRIISIDGFIYILSDDEIKEGDWCICLNKEGSALIVKQAIDFMPSESKKIIAKTDPKLTKLICKGEEDYFNYDNGDKINTNKLLHQIPKSLVEYYAKHQPEEVELIYYMHMRNPDPIRDEYKLKLINNEIMWVEPSKKRYNKAMKYAYGLYTLEEVERLLLEFRQDHLYTFDMTSEEDVKKWLKENLK